MKVEQPKSSIKGHFKVFGIAVVFGLGAYALVNIMFFTADYFGLHG